MFIFIIKATVSLCGDVSSSTKNRGIWNIKDKSKYGYKKKYSDCGLCLSDPDLFALLHSEVLESRTCIVIFHPHIWLFAVQCMDYRNFWKRTNEVRSCCQACWTSLAWLWVIPVLYRCILDRTIWQRREHNILFQFLKKKIGQKQMTCLWPVKFSFQWRGTDKGSPTAHF